MVVSHYTAGYVVPPSFAGPHVTSACHRLERATCFTPEGEHDAHLRLHADPDGTPKPDPVSFDNSRSARRRCFTAPFSGIHGWYWENAGSDTMTITLTTQAYTAATEFRSVESADRTT
jgi:hypothetical protein